MFWDQASSTKHGNVNVRNMHYRSVENPHLLCEVANQRQWNIKWTAIFVISAKLFTPSRGGLGIGNPCINVVSA